MSLSYLTLELIIDFTALILGIILITKKTDNHPKFYWGIIASLISLVFIWENIGWLVVRNTNPDYTYNEILNIEKMLKYYALASLVALFPIASIRPGYLTKFRIATFLLPTILTTTIGICYLYFNGNITPLSSAHDVMANLDKTDVRLRSIIFLFSMIIPLLYWIVPLRRKQLRRKINHTMYVFFGFMALLLTIYILFTLYISTIFFNAFGIVSIAMAILFSIKYIHSENPLSDYISTDPCISSGKSVLHPQNQLYNSIDNYLKETHLYNNPKYCIDDLSGYFNEKNSTISVAIKSGGYSGFREYINQLRLDNFREQVRLNPDRSIKELMNICGFTSRTTFYRLYAEKYNETPTELIEKETNKN